MIEIGTVLRKAAYHFITVTPETHRRVLARRENERPVDLRDVFGWNRKFSSADLDLEIFELMRTADVVRGADECTCAIRYATRNQLLLLHSGYPTVEQDAVFMGPDTYRFLNLVEYMVKELPPPGRIVDIGTGTGAAAILLARLFPHAEVVAVDINEKALRFAAINAALNDVANVTVWESDVVNALEPGIDLIVSNPPYLVDAERRRYRHGGGTTGAALSLRILTEGVRKLAPNGHLILYTGVAIAGGRDEFKASAEVALEQTPWRIQNYYEIDCDVFGEELETPAYARTERISVIGMMVGAR